MWLALVFAEDDADEDESVGPVPSVRSPEVSDSSLLLLNDHPHWSL